MDVHRCVTLHNEILLHGWVHSGNSAETFESNCKTWYDNDPSEAERIRCDLTADLFDFLKSARQPPDGQYFHFFYYVHSLHQGDGLYIDYERWQYDIEEGDEKRYVTLYRANQLASHPQGLAFDQKTNHAILLPSLWDMEGHFTNPDLWRPLESILESWLSMIQKGKIVAMSEQDRNAHPQRQAAQDPWIELPYSETIRNETVDTFNQLVQAIENRMPNDPATEEKEIIVGLVDEQALKTMQLAPGFLHEFLLRAQRPRFQFIAPGLSIPNSSRFANQPFWSYLADPTFHEIYDKFPPILLFTSSHPYNISPNIRTRPPDTSRSWTSLLKTSWYISSHAPSLSTAIRGIYRNYNHEVDKARIDPNHRFSYPFNKTHDYNAGLYISPGYTEDGIRLLLPGCVEGGGFAKMSDGAEARLREEVYGVGFTPFAGWRNASLLEVLTHWLGMVESGAWSVDEHGVVGGIEKWRDADLEETAEEYVLPMPTY